MHGDKPARRTVLATVGTLCSGALAGCSGSDTTETEGSNTEHTQDSQDSNSDNSSSTDEQSEGSNKFPTQEPKSQLEERLMMWPNNGDKYLLKIDNFKYINQAGLEARQKGVYTYEEALYAALNTSIEGEADSIWFAPTSPDVGGIDMIVNAEKRAEFAEEGEFRGFSSDFESPGSGADPELAKEKYAEFIRERLDGDGIVNHAGEIPEYTREALESGWQAK